MEKSTNAIWFWKHFFLPLWWCLMATHLSGRQTWTPAICLRRTSSFASFRKTMYLNKKVWLRDKLLNWQFLRKLEMLNLSHPTNEPNQSAGSEKIQAIRVTGWSFSILGSMISKAEYGQTAEFEHYPAPDTWKSTQRELKNPNFWERTLKTNIRSSISLLHFRVWHFSAAFLSSLLAGWNPVKTVRNEHGLIWVQKLLFKLGVVP